MGNEVAPRRDFIVAGASRVDRDQHRRLTRRRRRRCRTGRPSLVRADGLVGLGRQELVPLLVGQVPAGHLAREVDGPF